LVLMMIGLLAAGGLSLILVLSLRSM
jgi:hypothetical protein